MTIATIRPAAVAGTFYPDNPLLLSAELDTLLAAAPAAVLRPKALVSPHAGYRYSGASAARAMALLPPLAERIHRVVLFGPAHRIRVAGLAIPSSSGFSTPLGTVPLDHRALAAAAQLPQVRVDDAAHAGEHSLEVQLPFLQKVLGPFSLAPFVVGGASPAEVAEVMELLWGGEETLILVSSDLSHYLDYQMAQRTDRRSLAALLAGRPPLAPDQACGATALNALTEAARRHRLSATVLDSCNSGDTAGEHSRVVGYAALAYCEPAA